MDTARLLLHERLLLLVLDDEKGTSQSPHANPALAGAVLLDVLHSGAVEVEDGHLTGTAGTALPQGVLSEVATTIAEEPRPRSTRWWVDHLRGRLKPFFPRLANRLVQAGVLTEQQHKVLGLFASTPRFPERDQAPEKEVRERLRAVLVGERTPEPDDAALAGLAGAAGLVATVVGKEHRKQAQRRAGELGEDNELGEAVRQAIKAAQDAIIAASVTATTAATTATIT
jgi:plasmid stability protein